MTFGEILHFPVFFDFVPQKRKSIIFKRQRGTKCFTDRCGKIFNFPERDVSRDRVEVLVSELISNETVPCPTPAGPFEEDAAL